MSVRIKMFPIIASLFGGVAPALADSMTISPTASFATSLPNLSASVEGTGVPGIDGGHWFVWNNPSVYDSTDTFRIDRHVSSGTGLTGNTYKALNVYGTNNALDAGFEWTILSRQDNSANVETGAQNVAVDGTIFKMTPTSTVATTGAGGTGSTATITFAGGAAIPVGRSVTVAGVTPPGYNGVWKVTASAAGSVSFASTATGAQTAAGTIVESSVSYSAGMNGVCEDMTGEPDPVSACLGAEMDVYAFSATTDANRQRVGLQVQAAGTSGAHVGRGIFLAASPGITLDRAMEINGTMTIGFDFTPSTINGPAILLAAGQGIAFDGNSTTGAYNWKLLDYAGPMAFTYGGVTKMSLDNGGNFNVPGNIGSAANIGALGYVKGSLFVGVGSSPINSGSCAINTQVGGNSIGSFKANGACAGGTIVLTFATTAPNDWSCTATDATTPTATVKQSNTTASATTATFTATMAAGDLVRFQCFAF